MQEKTPLYKLIPSGWFSDVTKSSIWMVGYRRMMQTTRQDFSQLLIVDLGDVRAIFVYGNLSYRDSSNILEFGDDHVYHINASKLETKETNIGSWTILITPDVSDGLQRPEPEIRNSISIAEGLLAAINSPNMVFKKVFENIVELPSLTTTTFSPIMTNAATDLSPNLTAQALQVLSLSSANLQALPENIQNRVKLSLRWYSKSLIEIGIDGFLSIWIAIEVIGMPDTSNIRPALETLAKIYQVDYRTAVNRFQLGGIQNFRSKIVHDGKMFPVHFLLTKYLGAVYIDLLRETLHLPHESRAEKVLNNPQFAIDNFINQAQL